MHNIFKMFKKNKVKCYYKGVYEDSLHRVVGGIIRFDFIKDIAIDKNGRMTVTGSGTYYVIDEENAKSFITAYESWLGLRDVIKAK